MSTQTEAIRLRQENPTWTLQQIGDVVGVSRERVRQVLKKNSIQTIHYIEKPYCKNCGNPAKPRRKFCGPKCRYDYGQVEIVCIVCGVKKQRSTAWYNRMLKDPSYTGNGSRVFCSKKCFGYYAGKNWSKGGRRNKPNDN